MALSTQDIVNAYQQTVGAGTMSEADFVSAAMGQYGVSADQLMAAQSLLLGLPPASTPAAVDTSTQATVGTTGGSSNYVQNLAATTDGASAVSGVTNGASTGATTAANFNIPNITGGTFTDFGESGGWNVGSTTLGDPAFVKGNEYVVSDEIFWNPNTPMGGDLQSIVSNVQQGGGRAGLTITPYSMLDGKATADQLLNEVKNSGVDFVALDPYLFGDGRFTTQQGIEWTRQAVQALNDIGVDVKLVTQGFVPTGMSADEVRAYNAALANIPGVTELVNFGLEDAPDLGGGGFNKLYDPYGTVRGALETALPGQQITEADVQYWATHGGADAVRRSFTTGNVVADTAGALSNVGAQSAATDTTGALSAATQGAATGTQTAATDTSGALTAATQEAAADKTGDLGLITDYEGTQYDTKTILNLADQISKNLDLSSSSGGVFGSKGESVGFNFDESSRILGRAPTVVEQVSLDMARELAKQGVTNIDQLTSQLATGKEAILQGEDLVDYGEDRIGSNRNVASDWRSKLINEGTGGAFGTTYTGEGGTNYYVFADPATGKLKFTTGGFSTSDADLAQFALMLGSFMFPGLGTGLTNFISGSLPGAATATAAATTFNTIASSALSSGIMSGVTAAATGGDFEDGFKSGFVSGGIGAGVRAVVPTDFIKANPTLANGLINAGSSAITAAINGQDVGKALTTSLLNTGVTAATGALAQSVGEGAGLTKAQTDAIVKIAAPIITQLVQTGNVSDQTIIKAVLSGVGTAVNSGALADKGVDNTTVPVVDMVGTPVGGADTVTIPAGNDVAINAYQNAINAGMTPDEAMEVVNALTASTVTPVTGGAEIVGTDLGTLGANKSGEGFVEAGSGLEGGVKPDTTAQKIASATSFNDAFRIAREELGPGKTFEWNGKQYSTATFAERPDLAGTDVVPGATSTTAGAGRGSYAGFDPAAAAESASKTPISSTISDKGPTVFGIPIGTTDDAINTVKRMGEVVADFSKGLGEGLGGNFVKFFGDVGHIASTSLAGGDPKDAYITKDNLLSRLGKDVGDYYRSLTSKESNDQWNRFTKDVAAAPDYLKPFVAIGSALQNFGGVINKVGVEVGEDVAPILTGLGIGSKVLQLGASGTVKTVAATATLGDMAESMTGSYNNVMDRLKDNKTMTEAEKHWAATQAGAASMAATAVFGYGANAYLAKSLVGDLVDTAAKKVMGNAAVEYITEYPETVLQSLAEEYKVTGKITPESVSRANTDASISSLIGAKTAGSIVGSAEVMGQISNEFVGAESGDKRGLAVIQNADGQVAYVPAGDLKVGDTVDAGSLTQLQTPSEIVEQFNFSPEEAERVVSSVEQLDETREERAEQTEAERQEFDSQMAAEGAATQGAADVGATANVTTDPNTGVITQVATDPKANTSTTTEVNPNNNTNTQTTVNSETNTTTQTTVNTQTNVTTQTTVDSNTNTQTTVATDPNNNTQVTTVINTETGEVVDETVTKVPDDWTPPTIEITEGGSTDQITGQPTGQPTTTTKTPTKAAPKAPSKLPAIGGGAGMLAAFGGDDSGLAPQFLKSQVLEGYKDPLAEVKQIQEEMEAQAMMQNIDPRLAGILQQRMAPEPAQQAQRFDQDIGALARVLSGEPAQNENNYYSYGQEDDIDQILGKRGYKEGGYVAPLMAQGGMALPLMAKSGGALDHYEGRQNFKGGKHVAGKGDGQSDDIPAWLADGEFVFPADVVSALGNGSTKAGTDKLYEMMHAIRNRARSKGPKDLPPPAFKSPLDYLKSGKRSAK